MATQDKIGENEGIDAGSTDDVSYEPSEVLSDNPDEKSDAQRIADGEISVETGEDEMFVSPDSVYAKKPAEGEPSDKDDKKGKTEDPQDKDPADKKPQDKKPAAAPDPVQKRINKITREKYDIQREKERLEKENQELKTKLGEADTANKKADLEKSKPVAVNFETDAEYHEALGRWSAKMELHEAETAKVKPEKPEKPAETKQDDDPRKKIIDLGEETYPDFMEIVAAIPLPQQVFEAAVDSPHAHAIFYQLGKHPEEAKRIAGLTSAAAIAREIGKIEAQVAESEVYVPQPGDDSELLEKSKRKGKPPSAPPPVKPLGGTGKVLKDRENMTIAEYNDSRGFTRDGVRKSRVA